MLNKHWEMVVWDVVYLEEMHRFLQAWSRAVDRGQNLNYPDTRDFYIHMTMRHCALAANRAVSR